MEYLESDARPCPYCGRPVARGTLRPSWSRVAVPFADECQCRTARLVRAFRADEERLAGTDAAWRESIVATGIPERHADLQPNYAMGHRLRRDHGMLFCGKTGTYKTTTACATALGYIAEHGPLSVRYVNVTDMLGAVRSTYGGDGDERALTERWSRVPLLVLDDLGQGRMTEWAVGVIYGVLNRRYDNGNPTLITTQYRLSELGARISVSNSEHAAAALVRRIGEKCELYDFDKNYESLRRRYEAEWSGTDGR